MLGNNKLFITMKKNLNEALPALIPEFPINIDGHRLTLRFDVNINKTKKGVKLQFVLPDVPQDPRKAQQITNELGTKLQQKFAESGLQIIQDLENPYKNVIGFLIPLPSLATFIIKHVLKQEAPQEPEAGEEEAPEQLPPAEQSAEEVREIIMKRAGLR
jgi:hypothetical protein